MPEEIKVESLHTKAMIKQEMRDCLGDGKIFLTLGGLERLWLVDSPYLVGGELSEEALLQAMHIVRHVTDISPDEFHNELSTAIDTAFRAFELLKPEDEKEDEDNQDPFSPEWMADVMGLACQSMPSITYDEILHVMPLAMTLHLAVATARRNGAETQRPIDYKAALRKMRERTNGESQT